MAGRRSALRRTIGRCLVGWLAIASTYAASEGTVDAVGITVSDLDSAVTFYSDVLSFELTEVREVAGDAYEHAYGVFGLRMRIARMRLGAESVELMEFLAPQGRPTPVDSRSNDLWFQHVAIIVSDIDRAYAHLRKHKVRHASSGPQTLPDWNPNAGGIAAFYFRDPDANHLEILSFPPGKGDARWHAPSEALFLGIDHTAITVADTDRSLAFYQGALGMRIAGRSENYGIEQERLNNVFGARLRITALRADAGIGIELLEYLAPRTGREMPADTRSNDLWHWQVNFRRDDLDALGARLHERRYRLVSSGIVTLPDDRGSGAAERVLMVRDPDGHAMAFSDHDGH
ncbi:MAG TPA: VOC family protein [Gammaproteobacteria bacterium]|nr:VOC family protein [Gammaproteobacteria bacterium]